MDLCRNALWPHQDKKPATRAFHGVSISFVRRETLGVFSNGRYLGLNNSTGQMQGLLTNLLANYKVFWLVRKLLGLKTSFALHDPFRIKKIPPQESKTCSLIHHSNFRNKKPLMKKKFLTLCLAGLGMIMLGRGYAESSTPVAPPNCFSVYAQMYQDAFIYAITVLNYDPISAERYARYRAMNAYDECKRLG